MISNSQRAHLKAEQIYGSVLECKWHQFIGMMFQASPVYNVCLYEHYRCIASECWMFQDNWQTQITTHPLQKLFVRHLLKAGIQNVESLGDVNETHL